MLSHEICPREINWLLLDTLISSWHSNDIIVQIKFCTNGGIDRWVGDVFAQISTIFKVSKVTFILVAYILLYTSSSYDVNYYKRSDNYTDRYNSKTSDINDCSRKQTIYGMHFKNSTPLGKFKVFYSSPANPMIIKLSVYCYAEIKFRHNSLPLNENRKLNLKHH